MMDANFQVSKFVAGSFLFLGFFLLDDSRCGNELNLTSYE